MSQYQSLIFKKRLGVKLRDYKAHYDTIDY